VMDTPGKIKLCPIKIKNYFYLKKKEDSTLKYCKGTFGHGWNVLVCGLGGQGEQLCP
jgi:hypothetical protein